MFTLLICLVLTKDWLGNEKHFTLIDSSGSDPKDWLCNEKHLHSLIPLVLTLRIGRVMRSIYTH